MPSPVLGTGNIRRKISPLKGVQFGNWSRVCEKCWMWKRQRSSVRGVAILLTLPGSSPEASRSAVRWVLRDEDTFARLTRIRAIQRKERQNRREDIPGRPVSVPTIPSIPSIHKARENKFFSRDSPGN